MLRWLSPETVTRCPSTYLGREGNQFFALVVEALVGWHTDGAAAVAKLARQLASHTGREEEEITRCLFQKLSLLLMREGEWCIDPEQN